MRTHHIPWNKGRLLGQKPPLKPKEIWSIRIRLQMGKRTRDLALFNLAVDSKLRGCDLLGLKVRDLFLGGTVASRAIVTQRKTQRPVQFEITEPNREALTTWVAGGSSDLVITFSLGGMWRLTSLPGSTLESSRGGLRVPDWIPPSMALIRSGAQRQP